MTSTSLADLKAGKKPASPATELGAFLDKLKPQMALALPQHMNANRMARLALTAFSTTPALQECTFQSIAASLMTAAQMGLEPGVQGQGYLLPYKDRKSGTTICTFVPGWKGLADLVSRAGRATVWTGSVFEGDSFDYALGDSPFIKHRPADDRADDARMTHFYAVGRVKDAQMPVIEVWSTKKVEKHLNQYNKVGDRHYALASDSNFEMYARKVVLLQVLKYMPSSIELSSAIAASHAAEEGRNVVIDGDFLVRETEPAPEPVAAPEPAAKRAPRVKPDADGVVPPPPPPPQQQPQPPSFLDDEPPF